MADLTNQRDAWWNAGAKYIRTGVSRGTTTASAIITIATGFTRFVDSATADDEGYHLRNADGSRTMSTYFTFQELSPDVTTARFRVRKWAASGDNNASFTAAASTSGVTFRWKAFGV